MTKNPPTLLLLATALLSLAAAPSPAQPVDELAASGDKVGSTAAAKLLAAVTKAASEQRAGLVRAAISSDTGDSAEIVATLITAFPNEAPAFTSWVVQAVLALPMATETKGAILAAIAASAVDAAFRIPPSSVPDLVATINGVKAALAKVPPDLLPFVESFLAPISALPVAPAPRTVGGASFNTRPTQTILSDDAP